MSGRPSGVGRSSPAFAARTAAVASAFRAAVIGLTSIAVIGMLSAGCSSGPGTSVAGSASPAVSPAAPPPTLAPSPSPLPTGSLPAELEPLYPGLPPLDPAIDGSLDIDTFVAAVGARLPVSEVPGGPPLRFDTGEPDPSSHPLIGFNEGLVLIVLHGPVVVADVEWYLLTAAQLVIDVPTGWSPLTAPDGSDWILPAVVDCPTPPTTRELGALALTDGLPVCYGDAEITITGELACEVVTDPYVSGPSWLDDDVCNLDAPISVYGLADDLTPGRYVVTGHFDDPEARACVNSDGDEANFSRIQAILACRRAFVATSAEPAP